MPTLDIFDALQDAYPPVTEADIRNVEREIGLKFPGDYVQFLLKCNGGYCQHSVEFISEKPVPSWSSGGVSLRKVFAVTGDREAYDDIRSHTHLDQLFDSTIPRHFIPVVDSFFQDQFCLAGSGTEFGQVYYWDKDGGTVHYVAPSFTDFLNSIKLVRDDTPDLRDEEADRIPAFQAIRRGDIDFVRDYLAEGGDINWRTTHGNSLLMCAAHYRWPKIVTFLLARGADVGVRDSDGENAIFRAVAMQSLDCTKLLLAAGADANTRDNRGRSLLDLQEDSKAERIYQTLLSYGAKPSSAKP